MRRGFLVAVIAAASLVGCASTSEVVQLGPNSYMVGNQVRGGKSWSEVKAGAIKAAQDHCATQGKTALVGDEIQTSGARGWTPQNAEVKFSCVSEAGGN